MNYVKVLGSDEEISGVYGKGEGTTNHKSMVGLIPSMVMYPMPHLMMAGKLVSIYPFVQSVMEQLTITNYDNSPLHAWVIGGAPAGKEAHATIENLKRSIYLTDIKS